MICSAALNKSFPVCSSATTRPVCNAVGQNAFYCPSVECCHDLGRGFGLFQSLQEMEVLLGFLVSWSTRWCCLKRAPTEALKHSLFQQQYCRWSVGVLPAASPEVQDDLPYLHIQGEVVADAPPGQLFHLLSVQHVVEMQSTQITRNSFLLINKFLGIKCPGNVGGNGAIVRFFM